MSSKEKLSTIKEAMIEQVRAEIEKSREGENWCVSTNADLAARYGVQDDTVKKYLRDLPFSDRYDRISVLQHRKKPGRVQKRGLLRLREDLLSRVAEFGDNFRIPLKVAIEQSKDLALSPYELPVYMDNMFLFFLGMRQEACSTMRDCFDIVYRDVYEGTVVKRVITKLFGKKPSDVRRSSVYDPGRKRLQFFSDQVSFVCMALTGDNSSPPYELLTTPDRTQSYLRGFLYRGAKVDGKRVVNSGRTTVRPRVNVRGMFKLDLLRGVQRLVGNMDIEARSTNKGFTVYQLDSMRRLVDLHLLSKPQENRLETMLGNLGRA